ncbi:hypothetical protein [Anabaenopsis elenkinii]|uniref:Uncharacterized protein n=1 Tax=Anabaenopsis elenkinii CCIBt3563 TaxID=2779889 RepID=A0A7S6RBN8_9CYAN|nr:hypothetical protein [Anabaenopsis elenkinii]QOV21997.1 hypothetical protein IM676_15000 [Anabaenopsis elenkinii CCIBt3563]
MLWLTKIAARYFIKDRLKIFQTINFDLKTPIKADDSIIQFVNHLEQQKPLMLKTWQLARSHLEIKEHPKTWRDSRSND